MLRCVLCCWLPWWLSISVPRPPNLECFSALISGWTYPGPFPAQTILSIHEAFAPLYPFKSFLGWGCRAQLTGQTHLPWCPLAPTNFLKIDGKWLTQTCSLQPTPRKMGNLLPYTHHTLSRLALSWLSPPVSFTASRLCFVKMTTPLDFWGCLWINESISNLLHTRFYCT